MNRQVALIFGITGQDGAYLASLLLKRGYDVCGTCRCLLRSDRWRLRFLGIEDQVSLFDLSLSDFDAVRALIRKLKPQKIFNLAGITSLSEADSDKALTLRANGAVVGEMIDAITDCRPDARFFQASSSQIFGFPKQPIQTEETPVSPENVYAEAKVIADEIVSAAREQGIFAVSGILYNHESPLRTHRFLSRKVTSGMVAACASGGEPLSVGNLDAERDWSFAGDFMQAALLSLEHKRAGRYVLASGERHCVRDWIEFSASHLGKTIEWRGSGAHEVGVDSETGQKIVSVSEEFYRANDPGGLIGDSSLAKSELGWTAQKSFSALVQEMVNADVERAVGDQP